MAKTPFPSGTRVAVTFQGGSELGVVSDYRDGVYAVEFVNGALVFLPAYRVALAHKAAR